MARSYRLSFAEPVLKGQVSLESSKSISNRVLIIRALSDEEFSIHHLSQSDDTRVLMHMLEKGGETLHAGHAGSSYRFMLALACLGDRTVTIDASAQLRRRPIGPLVNALRTIGADITYLDREGFPPVKVTPKAGIGQETHELELQAGVSSQYITALMLIAPKLPHGLTIRLSGNPVSASYIHMTQSIMEYFGTKVNWEGQSIRIAPGEYSPKEITVEGDWSAASYYFGMAALAKEAEIEIIGLGRDSLQGDAVVANLYTSFGVETHYTKNGIVLTKTHRPNIDKFEYDFTRCPDLAQTVMVTLAGLGISGMLTGLRTLRIKETDRLAAMQTELARVKTTLEIIPKADDLTCTIHGKARWKDKARFDTYDDHRMAMALAQLSCIKPVIIHEPNVVSKSYPGFWQDAKKLGMRIEEQRGSR